MLTVSIHAETHLQLCPPYNKSTLRRTTGCNTYYWVPYHQTNSLRRIHICQRRSLLVLTAESLPEEYTTDMVYPMRKTTTTHVDGKDIPSRQIEDDVLQPGAANNNPAGLTGNAAWPGYTDVIIRPTQSLQTQRIPGTCQAQMGTVYNLLGRSRPVPRAYSASSSI